MEQGEDGISKEDFREIKKMLSIINYRYILIGIIVALLIMGFYNKGYGDGYTYVKEFKEKYEGRFCICFNNTQEKMDMPLELRTKIELPNFEENKKK